MVADLDQSTQSSTLAERNRQYFTDESDKVLRKPWIIATSKYIGDHLHSTATTWLGLKELSQNSELKVRMLDFACGSGTASLALMPFVNELRGIDVAEGMVQKYNQCAVELGLTVDQMSAIRADLMSSKPDDIELLNSTDLTDFDVIVISMALHHLEDPAGTINDLVKRLKQGGRIVVVDWVLDLGEASDAMTSHHAASHTIALAGFTKADMEGFFKVAGCQDIDFVLAKEKSKTPRGEMQLFFAKGVK